MSVGDHITYEQSLKLKAQRLDYEAEEAWDLYYAAVEQREEDDAATK